MWTKNTPLVQQGPFSRETWIRETSRTDAYSIDVYAGKKTNLLALKRDVISDLKAKIEYYRASRRKLYAGETEYVPNCPVTGTPTSDASPVAKIYGANYVQNPTVGHVYVSHRPSESAIHDFYLNDVTYAATYTNRESAESRLAAIAVPWLDWAVKAYEKQYGRKPRSVLDVGSGAGHFVEACRRTGITARGVELSEPSRKFAKDIWGLELDGRNFLETSDDYVGYDIVTFWGLLEHTPNPAIILQKTLEIVSRSDAGMVISKVPRWQSLSTAAQQQSPETVIRHIDPMGHIMLFSDASAAELYVLNGFAPTAAWYYGMDVYETLMQAANISGDYTTFRRSAEFQIEVQQLVDEARFSDGLTLAGIPQWR